MAAAETSHMVQSKLFSERYGPWAVVTGASSGIGQEFATQLAGRGLNVVLVARRIERLDALAAQLSRQHGVRTLVIEADLSRLEAIDDIARRTLPLAVGLLVNCAGFTTTSPFLARSLAEQMSLLDVNGRAPMALMHVFGERFVAQARGGIINVASASAALPMPQWANYAAVKAYVLHLSEALWYELRPQGVDVLALCPGNTKTAFAQVSGSGMRGGMAPEAVVALALRRLGHAPVAVPGFGNLLASWVPRLISRKAGIVLGAKVMGQ
jgi:hypothetical protein